MITILWRGFILFFLISGNSNIKLEYILFFLFLLLGMFSSRLEISSENTFHFLFLGGLRFLTIWLFIICIMTSKLFIFKKKKNLNFLVSLLILILLITFTTIEYFSFYLWFELGVIPILFVILWGRGSKSRLEAGLFLVFFTITRALLLFFCLFYLQSLGEGRSHNRFFNGGHVINLNRNFLQIILFLAISTSFLVKFPIFFLHIWLPKAHVEAPIMGSIILAGILLKLGGIGFFLFQKVIFWRGRLSYFMFLRLCLWGRLLVGLICFHQNDRKVLIAFSRVNHITLTIFSFMCWGGFSIMGSFIIMMGHGLASSLLFFLVRLPYSKTSNRLFLSIGQIDINGTLPILWLMGLLINMGFPPFLNFFGELLIISHLLRMPYFIIILFLNFIMGALYTFTLITNILQKKKNFNSHSQNRVGEGGQYINILIGWLHLFPLFFFLNFSFFY